jgi:hypothetical protein
LVSKPGDYNGNLQSYIELKAPATDLSGYSLTTDIDEELLLKADKTSLSEYAASINMNLESLASTIVFINKIKSQNVNQLTKVVSTKAEVDQLTTLIEKPGDYNGNLQSYIELKAPEQTPPDLSGLVSKPGDYNGNLQSYIELKAPEQTPPDLSGLVSKPGDYNGNLQSYIELKACNGFIRIFIDDGHERRALT